jgi:uncharacterized protein YkwD
MRSTSIRYIFVIAALLLAAMLPSSAGTPGSTTPSGPSTPPSTSSSAGPSNSTAPAAAAGSSTPADTTRYDHHRDATVAPDKHIDVVDPAPTDPNGLNSQEAEFVALVNKERTSRGLNALTVDPTLIKVARGHSEEMCRLNYFDHHSPTAGIVTPMDRYMKALHETGGSTPEYVLVGENIYYCSIFNDQYNVAYGHQSLMNSPGHRANILEPRFVKIGVGTYRDAKGEFWVTEEFLRDTAPQTAKTDGGDGSGF